MLGSSRQRLCVCVCVCVCLLWILWIMNGWDIAWCGVRMTDQRAKCDEQIDPLQLMMLTHLYRGCISNNHPSYTCTDHQTDSLMQLQLQVGWKQIFYFRQSANQSVFTTFRLRDSAGSYTHGIVESLLMYRQRLQLHRMNTTPLSNEPFS